MTNNYFPQTVLPPSVTLQAKLDELKISSKQFAIQVAYSEEIIEAILNNNDRITEEIAASFENVLKIPANFWLRYQARYDEYKMQIATKEWARQFPYSQMAKYGWVKITNKIEEKISSLLSFFDISNFTMWEDNYLKQHTEVNFRISLKNTQNPYAIAAWLRQGEYLANYISIVPYNEHKFRDNLEKIKDLTLLEDNSFWDLLQQLCIEAGVKVVYTPTLPKAPIYGSTRWVGENPLIQLSAKYDRNDIFWFTFFHEAAHILLHGKNYFSLENVKYDSLDKIKEQEADEFAINYTFSKIEENEVVSFVKKNKYISLIDISNFAKKFNIHPAFIVGRLQRNDIIKPTIGRKFLKSIQLK
jgi:HTH-type transcriptional regulator/antitoxin HigA